MSNKGLALSTRGYSWKKVMLVCAGLGGIGLVIALVSPFIIHHVQVKLHGGYWCVWVNPDGSARGVDYGKEACEMDEVNEPQSDVDVSGELL